MFWALFFSFSDLIDLIVVVDIVVVVVFVLVVLTNSDVEHVALRHVTVFSTSVEGRVLIPG